MPSAATLTTTLDALLTLTLENNGSDLHLATGIPPRIRVNGHITTIPHAQELGPDDVRALMFPVMTDRQRATFEAEQELDFAYSLPGRSRFRVNLSVDRGNTRAVLRAIPWQIQDLDELGIPERVGNFADLPRGLVLVTGPTGSGKSTTLAAIIDRANRTRNDHIVTIEDPIEYIHPHQNCIVTQREVGGDTASFATALRHVLRQDPDIILVGELRDKETIEIALTAAETGHLVLGTLHTQSAKDTITRVIDVFPENGRDQIRTQLAASIQGIVTQTLCRTSDGNRRVPAVEIMTATPSVRNMIREGKLEQLPSVIQSSSKDGMITLDQTLASLVRRNTITLTEAIRISADKNDLANALGYPTPEAMHTAATTTNTTSKPADW